MAIEQHPLPQDVTGYRFRLIGDMTLKQFLYLVVAVLVAVIIHNLPLPFFFRYPLEIIFLLLGVGLAFVPIEGRPLDKWIIAFIKSIYSPTQYVWKKQKSVAISTPTKTPPQTKPSISTPVKTKPISPSFPLPPKSSSIPPSPPSSSKTSSKPKPAPIPSTPPVKPVDPTPTSTSTSLPPRSKTKPVHPVSTPTPNPKRTSSTSQTPTTNLPIPFTPTTPNTLVGLTLTPDNHILDAALIEIILNGLTVRATKSNKLGQFLFAKPLENGLYQIKTEKPGFNFNIYSLKLESNIIKPLKIQAQSTTTNNPSSS